MSESGLALGVSQHDTFVVGHFRFASRYMGVTGPERHKVIQAKVVHAGIPHASDAGQDRRRLHFDEALEWPPELATYGMSTGVVVISVFGRWVCVQGNTSLIECDCGRPDLGKHFY